MHKEYKEYKQEEHWDRHYKKKSHAILNYDGWLDVYVPLFDKKARIVDVGCGAGSDTDYLLKCGFKVQPLDFSDEALKVMHELVPEAVPIKADMTEKFPFEDDSFDVVVADLSLHYFEWSLTVQIVSELRRILKNNGILASRFNSDKDFGYGADSENIIEPGLCMVNGRTKRFFSGKDIDCLFAGWEPICQRENITNRYLKTKAYWEYIAYNKKKG